jgi:Family of unknown function (DUF6263)
MEFHVKRLSSIGRAVILLTLVVSAAPAYAQGVTLRYRWTKGDSLTYRMTNQTNSSISGMPGAGDLTVDQTMTQVLKVTAEEVAPDGVATLRQSFQAVRMEMNGPMGKVVYDSSVPDKTPDPQAEAMGKVMGSLVGESIIVVMAPEGTVRKVEGASRILDKVMQGMSADPAAAAAAQGLKTMLSDDALKATLSQSFSMLPTEPVKAGDTWTGKISMGNDIIGRIVGTSTFTLKAIEGTGDPAIARVAVALALKQDGVPAPSGPMGMVMKLGDSRGEGEILFSVARGRIQRNTMRTEMPSTMTMTGPDGSPATMQNRTTTTMTMELVER